MIKLLKKVFFEWLIYIPVVILFVFYINCFEELFFQIKNLFLKIVSTIILAYSFLNIILDGYTVFSIEENQWEDFKRGLDYHIDKMVDSLVLRCRILCFLMFFWVVLYVFILFRHHNEISLYKFFFVFLTPIIINSYLIKNTLSIKNDYEKNS